MVIRASICARWTCKQCFPGCLPVSLCTRFSLRTPARCVGERARTTGCQQCWESKTLTKQACAHEPGQFGRASRRLFLGRNSAARCGIQGRSAQPASVLGSQFLVCHHRSFRSWRRQCSTRFLTTLLLAFFGCPLHRLTVAKPGVRTVSATGTARVQLRNF